jgi:hypothetical protein
MLKINGLLKLFFASDELLLFFLNTKACKILTTNNNKRENLFLEYHPISNVMMRVCFYFFEYIQLFL